MIFNKKKKRETLPSDKFKKCLHCPNNECGYCVKMNANCPDALKYCK